jgi:hypothetical protein
MPLPIVGAGLGVLGGIFGAIGKRKAAKAKEKAAKEFNASQVKARRAGAGMGEERRIQKANIGQSFLSGLGSAPAYGGRISPDMGIDPKLFEALSARQDVESAVPDLLQPADTSGAGGFMSALGEGLGGASSAIGGMVPSSGGAGQALSLEELLAQLGKTGGSGAYGGGVA